VSLLSEYSTTVQKGDESQRKAVLRCLELLLTSRRILVLFDYYIDCILFNGCSIRYIYQAEVKRIADEEAAEAEAQAKAAVYIFGKVTDRQ
jgi:hypothetical protein